MVARAIDIRSFKQLHNPFADFNQTWQDCSFGGPPPKLLKTFGSTAQNGGQS